MWIRQGQLHLDTFTVSGGIRLDSFGMAEDKVGRREAKKQYTHQAIVQSAKALFRTNGFSETTVAQIAEAAKVSERTFFRYFASKEDLLLEDTINLFAAVEEEMVKRPVAEWPPLSLQIAARTVLTQRLAAGEGVPLLAPVREQMRRRVATGLVRAFMDWEDRLAGVVANRLGELGDDPTTDENLVYAKVVAKTSIGALRSAVQLLEDMREERPVDLVVGARIFAECFGVLSGCCRHRLFSEDAAELS